MKKKQLDFKMNIQQQLVSGSENPIVKFEKCKFNNEKTYIKKLQY